MTWARRIGPDEVGEAALGMGDRGQWLRYVIHGGPGEWTAGPEDPAAPGQTSAELWERARPLVAVSHPWGSATGAEDPGGLDRSLSYGRLPDGTGLLCSSRTMREGGVSERRMDVLHLPAGGEELREVRPIDAWGAAVDELPSPGGGFTQEKLVAFAREHKDRVGPFLADVRRLFGDRAGRQIVLAEGEQETVAHWIALACASLTGEYARALTFVTRTAQPYEAPQQILGIGPEADFDREDPELLQHLYRVHDGLGGTGSPPVVDPWAEAMAWRWTMGTPLRQPEKGDPFVLDHTLGEGELPSPDSDMWRTLGNSPEQHPDLVRSLTRRAQALTLPGPDESDESDESGELDELDELIRICGQLADEVPVAALRPFATELARKRLALACDGHLRLDQAALARLPLDDEARRVLHQEFAAAIDDALHGRLRGTDGPWADALSLALHLGGDGSTLVRECAERIARALVDQGEEVAAHTVELLDRLDSPVVDRLTLKSLADRGARVLAWAVGSPAVGGWLRRRSFPEVPFAVRLAVLAAEVRAETRAEGVELFAALARELEPRGRITDAGLLNQVWDAVWPHGQPEPADVPRLLEVCSPRVCVEAGRAPLFANWINKPPRFDRTLLDFAREARADHRLPPLARDRAELLAVTGELDAGALGVAEAVARTGGLWSSVSPLPRHVETGVLTVFARALADADLTVPGAKNAYGYLIQQTREELLQPYKEAVERLYGTDERLRALAREHRRVASLFLTWFPRTPGDRPEWRAVAEGLLHNFLGAAVQRMDERDVAAVTAWIYQFEGKQRRDEWAQWSYQRRGR
ncbi:GTPase-associated protein 1-related protein [Streptomyces sp. NPDC048172]|uniref:GTPase-associated protein 1-related protein n=1 Tax=Streptomyces sp. NPDC048172 TaxID=3365505 RepID=UPI00371E2C03